ncbi:putative lipase [Mycobacterium antarcticum]|uniref:lipase family protein n=1 Tax=unclassified Mycolicibacterium TaxID=2636767 RepID=UPI00239C0DCD|nr:MULTISPECIES: lipase family protein [unclassified Mycolicibacterium]GLP78532.1 putative lipase [Mycolicibacterium sp. TUM20983]GLP79775.1 putative lipase [Mycolicibacterium sp. TUM20984]
MRRRAVWIGVVLAVVVGLIVVGSPLGFNLIGRQWNSSRDDGHADPVPIEGANLGGTETGSVMSAMTMPEFLDTSGERNLRAARVVYRSTNGDSGAQTTVSGAVFTPDGPPPPGGWPVIALAHGTTGLDEECAPSLTDDLWGLSEPVLGYVKNGYAVALTDYQGLGEEGVHPYMDAKTAGLNVIDSVRALRHTFPDVSDRWLAFGGSQGGAAAWAADELAATYAPELTIVGAVANSPAADVAGVVDEAQRGTLTYDQMPLFLTIVESVARLHDDVDRGDFRSGAAASYWVPLLSCNPETSTYRAAQRKRLTPDQFTPRTMAAADRLRGILAGWALPRGPLSAPLSVVYGADDTFIDARWTTDAIARQCALGGVVQWQLQSGRGHGDVDIASQFTWLADRFAGQPAVDQCP